MPDFWASVSSSIQWGQQYVTYFQLGSYWVTLLLYNLLSRGWKRPNSKLSLVFKAVSKGVIRNYCTSKPRIEGSTPSHFWNMVDTRSQVSYLQGRKREGRKIKVRGNSKRADFFHLQDQCKNFWTIQGQLKGLEEGGGVRSRSWLCPLRISLQHGSWRRRESWVPLNSFIILHPLLHSPPHPGWVPMASTESRKGLSYHFYPRQIQSSITLWASFVLEKTLHHTTSESPGALARASTDVG